MAALRSGRMLHGLAIRKVTAAPMAYFDTTPLGRILNRFSGDLQKVDVQLGPAVASLGDFVFSLVGNIVINVLVSPYILVAVLPLGWLYAKVSAYYRESSRELLRLDSVSKSPIYAAFTEALNGAPTIQAFGVLSNFEVANVKR